MINSHFFKTLLILTTFLMSIHVNAREIDEIGIGFGMSSITFTESETSLEGDNISEPASGAVSVMILSLYYKFIHGEKYSFFATGYFPIISSGDNSSFGVGFGGEYYFTKENNIVVEKTNSLSLSIDPTIRYYLTFGTNLVYLSYITESKKKNDLNAELNFGGGLTYSFSPKYGVKADVSVGRGVGVLTSTFGVRVFASILYYWGR